MPARLLLLAWLLAGLATARPVACTAAGPFQELRLSLDGQRTWEAKPDSLHGEPQRLVAAVLAVTLGPFAAHRLYLGTEAKVPIVYGLTFGGFGILVLIDLGHILFTKDLAPYRHNGKVLMWAKPRPEEPTPP
ncbi:MAG TPA: TM2 domain-containing protein [Flavobacteriales bacterium]|nr:TM2 domain-containing protein [Flavobacteriales bacterium]